jgi:Retrotransposon gag protein
MGAACLAPCWKTLMEPEARPKNTCTVSSTGRLWMKRNQFLTFPTKEWPYVSVICRALRLKMGQNSSRNIWMIERTLEGWLVTFEGHWRDFKKAFKDTFIDIAKSVKVENELKSLKITGSDINSYIATFTKLIKMASYLENEHGESSEKPPSSQRVQEDVSTRPRYKDQSLGRYYRRAWGAEQLVRESDVEDQSGSILSGEVVEGVSITEAARFEGRARCCPGEGREICKGGSCIEVSARSRWKWGHWCPKVRWRCCPGKKSGHEEVNDQAEMLARGCGPK